MVDVQRTVTMTDYDKLVDLFYKRLAEQRQYNHVSSAQSRGPIMLVDTDWNPHEASVEISVLLA